jgi:mannose-6-phosphate isomerase-like protein (cupin superfamily)
MPGLYRQIALHKIRNMVCSYASRKIIFMQNKQQILYMTPIGMVCTVVKSAAQTNGQSLEMEWRLQPYTGGTPVHIHPTAKETYKVLEGQLEVYLQGRWRLLTAGEELAIPEGAPHTFRNPTGNTTRVYNTHAPALHFAEYFTGLRNIVQKLSHRGTKKLAMNLNTATHVCMLMKKHRQELVAVKPPRLVVSLLNLVGKLRGLKV